MSDSFVTRQDPVRRGVAVTLGAVFLVYLPYFHAFWLHLSGREFSVAELMLYPLVIGGGAVVLITALVRHLFRERLIDLNRRPGRRLTDIVVGVLMCAVSFVVMVAFSLLIAPLLPEQSGPPPKAVTTLIKALGESPLLLAVWLGPVVWLGVATFEELSRVFLLDRLWKLWPGALCRWAVIVLSAVVFGLVHIYQGVAAVVAVSLLGLVYALYYLRFGRVWPLIIGHALFDSVQIASAVSAGRGGTP